MCVPRVSVSVAATTTSPLAAAGRQGRSLVPAEGNSHNATMVQRRQANCGLGGRRVVQRCGPATAPQACPTGYYCGCDSWCYWLCCAERTCRTGSRGGTTGQNNCYYYEDPHPDYPVCPTGCSEEGPPPTQATIRPTTLSPTSTSPTVPGATRAPSPPPTRPPATRRPTTSAPAARPSCATPCSPPLAPITILTGQGQIAVVGGHLYPAPGTQFDHEPKGALPCGFDQGTGYM